MGGGGDKGGGGGSGAVSYPGYMTAYHKWYLEQAQESIENWGNDEIPYRLARATSGLIKAYDPDADLAELQDEFDLFKDVVAEIDGRINWPEFMNDAENAVLNSSLLSEDAIEDAVSAYAAKVLPAQAAATARYNAGMSDLNAVMGSAYVIGLGLIDADRVRAINEFRANLQLQMQQQRLNVALQGVGSIMQMYGMKQEFSKAAVLMAAEFKRLAIVSRGERDDKNLDISVKDSVWDLQLYQHGANLLATIGGGVVSPDRGSSKHSGASVLGGALSGAASGAYMGGMLAGAGTGAQSGAVTGPQGALIGAGIGGLLGMFGAM